MTGQMVRFGEGDGQSGYLARPEGGVGPGVLVLHAWWGLNDFFKSVCDRLAAEGYVAFAPDLYGGGQVATTVEEAERLLQANEGPGTQETAVEAVRFLVQQPGVRPIGVGVIGFSMGAAWAAETARLRPGTVRAVVLHYGAWAPDLSNANAAFLCHFCDEDDWEPRENVEELRKTLEDAGRPATFHFYPNVGHWFMESNRQDAHNTEAAELAWSRTLAFLAEQLAEKDEPLPRNHDELIARIEQGWKELRDLVAGHSEEELLRPGPEGWSIKEHLAHVTFWERQLLRSYMEGRPATGVADMDEATLKDFNAINAIDAERSRTKSLRQVLDEGQSLHAELIAKLTSEPFERWMQPRFADDPDERPLMLWIVGNTYGHYEEHAGYVRKLLPD
jgi:carboxymethylenebutenolidase